ncbi:PREDICTED: homeobox-leucine zipper protein HOX11-like isoform X2 [Ipomoea nil]|uniref:homeobox-leucine zipper protein HOX11-like isoform X2 n=1 Tax=Ipomoea nil TaxID=35883 RepID=UPI0009010B8C|nr:PREDICTED: homeobox-leucine zipper protein HOX11-like isoform X2 [Ipomoea nil]
MELGLSLGDSSSKPEDHHNHRPRTAATTKKDGLNFCMALGILSDIEQPGNTRKPKQNDSDDRISNDDDDQIASEEEEEEEGHNCRALVPRASLQLDLLPLAPVPVSRHHPFPWSSGSSENGSSGNMELQTTARGFDVSRLPKTAAAATEEVSSSFCMESASIFKRGGSGMLSICEAAGEAERASSRASDEDENNGGVNNARKKLRLSKQQSAFLEESFKENHTLNPKQKLALAKQLNLRPRQVEVWFQNRRARTKLKQTEIDCDYLKRCCETLTEENKRLHKELQELRALKTCNPFYSNLPATTLTMCPSCEKVATTTTTTTTATVTTAIATISDSHPTATAMVATVTNPESIPKAIPFLTRKGSFPFTTSHNHAPS